MSTLDLFETTFGGVNSAVRRDLSNNLQRLLESSSLDPQEAYATLLATATAAGSQGLAAHAEEKLKALDFNEEQIREARESAAIMGMLNMYYRFRHMIEDGQGAEALESYKTAGLRMTSLGKPVLGKERFEMLALAVSVINGCANCVNAHEQELKKHNVSTDKIHDLARLAAVVRGIASL